MWQERFKRLIFLMVSTFLKVFPGQLEKVLSKAFQICYYPLQLFWRKNCFTW